MNNEFTVIKQDQINDQTNLKGQDQLDWWRCKNDLAKEHFKSMEARHLNDDDWIKGFWQEEGVQLKSIETLHRFLQLAFQGVRGDKT